MPAFVASLGIMYVARRQRLLITNGLTYNNLAGNAPNSATPGFDWLSCQSRLFDVPIGVLALIVISLIGSVAPQSGLPLGVGYMPPAAAGFADLSGVLLRR